jgi:DNA-binding protein H-NS
MESDNFKSMSFEELWNLNEDISAVLQQKITEKKAQLDECLRKIQPNNDSELDRVRRRYPPVLQKYQNPKNPAETWSGRGLRPRWVTAQLRAGKKLDDFLIRQSSVQKRRRAG